MTDGAKRLYDEVVKRLQPAAEFGESMSADGARLVGHVPHVGPEAWLHPPLGEEEIDELEDRLPHPSPGAYRDWLRQANGFGVFSRSLELFGLQGELSRDPDRGRPFDLALIDAEERAASAGAFEDALTRVAELSRWRESPVKLERNPVPEPDVDDVVRLAAAGDARVHADFWRSWLSAPDAEGPAGAA